jgi:hypothetical protein
MSELEEFLLPARTRSSCNEIMLSDLRGRQAYTPHVFEIGMCRQLWAGGKLQRSCKLTVQLDKVVTNGFVDIPVDTRSLAADQIPPSDGELPLELPDAVNNELFLGISRTGRYRVLDSLFSVVPCVRISDCCCTPVVRLPY